MAKDKSLMEKFADTVRGVAKTAADAASAALQPDTPASKAGQRSAAYVPLAADGLMADPMMVAPEPRPRRKRRTAPKRATSGKARRPAKGLVRASSAKGAQKASTRKSRKAASRTTPRKAKAPAKRRAAKSRRR